MEPLGGRHPGGVADAAGACRVFHTWLERVRVLYGIGDKILRKKQKIAQLGQALSAWFLRDLIWPPGSKSSLMFALTVSYKKEMSALLRQTIALGKRSL